MAFHLSPFVEAGPFVFVSGQLAFDETGALQGRDVSEQTALTLANVARLLARCGLALDDVVKTTVWITRQEDFAAFDAAYARAFGEHKPARATVIAGLAAPGALVEIEAVAMRRAS